MPSVVVEATVRMTITVPTHTEVHGRAKRTTEEERRQWAEENFRWRLRRQGFDSIEGVASVDYRPDA